MGKKEQVPARAIFVSHTLREREREEWFATQNSLGTPRLKRVALGRLRLKRLETCPGKF